MTVTTVIAGQVKPIRTTVEQPGPSVAKFGDAMCPWGPIGTMNVVSYAKNKIK